MQQYMIEMIGLGLGTGFSVGLIALVLGMLWRVKDII